MIVIENFIIVLDKIYRCYILRCLNMGIVIDKTTRELSGNQITG